MREIEETIDKYYIEFTAQKCEVEDQEAILIALKKIIDEAKENRKKPKKIIKNSEKKKSFS